VIIWALLYFPRSEEVAESVTTEFLSGTEIRTGISTDTLLEELEDPDSALSAELEHRLQGAYLEESYLGRFGKAVQPVFAPAGFDWKITIGVLASFPAREVMIATLGIIYNMGSKVDEESEGLRERMAQEKWTTRLLAGTPVFPIPVVLAVIFLLYFTHLSAD